MGILAPLFLAGLAALSIPLILHLIRRTPRGRQDFSSLMFLSPSPPRLTRRSRIDNWLLLLLRLAALALLALAFARPFLREEATLALDSLPARRVAILIDTSASMRRGDVWPQAVARVERELGELGPRDDVALVAFGERPHTIVDFEKDTDEPTSSRVELVRNELRKLEPGWDSTDLGLALLTTATELDAATDLRQSSAQPQIVVVSDFQQGSRIQSLQSFDWPERVRVITHRIAPAAKTNAFAQLLPAEADAPTADARVRVVNAADSAADQFFLRWEGAETQAGEAKEVAVYVPAGQTRVVRLPHTPGDLLADQIVLRGDDHKYDNTHFVVPPRRQNVRLLYIGGDALNDPQGLPYYLGLALANDPLRQVEIQLAQANAPLVPSGAEAPQLVVVSRALSADEQDALARYVEAGGALWLAPVDRAAAMTLPRFFDDVELTVGDPVPEDKYLLFGEIDFTHPLFAPFANPRYSDFTRIHFWNRRPIAVGTRGASQVVARFDDGAPAILDRRMGHGRVFAFTAGWQPDESQLALSSKFVPLAGGLVDLACGGKEQIPSVSVHDSVMLPAASGGTAFVVYTPDAREVKVPAGATAFTETSVPGIYRAKSPHEELRFAVNLAASESQTAPLDLEQIEQWGVRFGVEQTKAQRLERVRQERDTELESRQQAWRWLIVGVLAVLIVETWLAGRTAHRIASSTETVA